MAAKPLPTDIKEGILKEWRMGGKSQRDIADEYKVGLASVNKICKGIEQDAKQIVNAGVQYQQALQAQGERMANAIEQRVNETAKRLEWLAQAALKNVNEAMQAECDNQQDYRNRAGTINMAKETLVGKAADTQINLNQQTAVLNVPKGMAAIYSIMNGDE